MSLWWARRDQLDRDQVRLIEQLNMQGDYLVLGPPGSGKTNVLLRRAQFVRTQGVPNVLVLTFTRPLTEFLRTGCVNAAGDEIFPRSLVTTIESWIRDIYRSQKEALPQAEEFSVRKQLLASGALDLLPRMKRPKYDVVFVDEAQDLIPEEVQLLRECAHRVFFVGDDRQQIFGVDGLAAVRAGVAGLQEEALQYHYRLAPEICEMADRILSSAGKKLADTSHYDGPRPARITPHKDRRDQLPALAITALKSQMRAYGDMIRLGDRLGVVVPTTETRSLVLEALAADRDLSSAYQEVRARSGDASDGHDPTLDPSKPILVLTEPACKGLEFRALHWLYVDENAHHRTEERYYTVVTRAKSSLDMYYSTVLPAPLAKSYAEPVEDIWA